MENALGILICLVGVLATIGMFYGGVVAFGAFNDAWDDHNRRRAINTQPISQINTIYGPSYSVEEPGTNRSWIIDSSEIPAGSQIVQEEEGDYEKPLGLRL